METAVCRVFAPPSPSELPASRLPVASLLSSSSSSSSFRVGVGQMSYWLIKSEPFVYSWEQLVVDGKTDWTGVRNFEARNNLRAMKRGDLCLYYHSNEGKAVVGVARVSREHFPDETVTAEEGSDWSAVEVEPVAPFAEPVTLATIKGTKAL